MNSICAHESFITYIIYLYNRIDYDKIHGGLQLASDIWISSIKYADDVDILAENLANLSFIRELVNYFSNHIGIEINLSKTKVLSNCPSVGLTPAALTYLTLEEVPVFKIFGSQLLPSGQAENEVDVGLAVQD